MITRCGDNNKQDSNPPILHRGRALLSVGVGVHQKAKIAARGDDNDLSCERISTQAYKTICVHTHLGFTSTFVTASSTGMF